MIILLCYAIGQANAPRSKRVGAHLGCAYDVLMMDALPSSGYNPCRGLASKKRSRRRLHFVLRLSPAARTPPGANLEQFLIPRKMSIMKKFPVPFGTGNFICNSVVALCVFDAWFGDVDFEFAAGQGIGIVHADGLICISL